MPVTTRDSFKTGTTVTPIEHPSNHFDPISMSTLLNKQAVSARLGVSVRTLDNLVSTREFPPGARVGRYLYWTEAAVTAWHTRIFAVQLNWRP